MVPAGSNCARSCTPKAYGPRGSDRRRSSSASLPRVTSAANFMWARGDKKFFQVLALPLPLFHTEVSARGHHPLGPSSAAIAPAAPRSPPHSHNTHRAAYTHTHNTHGTSTHATTHRHRGASHGPVSHCTSDAPPPPCLLLFDTSASEDDRRAAGSRVAGPRPCVV